MNNAPSIEVRRAPESARPHRESPRRVAAMGAALVLFGLPSCAERRDATTEPARPGKASTTTALAPAVGPDFPLQAWMKATAARTMVSGSPEALVAVFDRIERFDPPGYDGWKTIAGQGAAAARASNVDGCRVACKACHDRYRQSYRDRDRRRPLR